MMMLIILSIPLSKLFDESLDMNKLALGTVQFGLDYGINNQRGKIPSEDVYAILDKAKDAGIDLLDTAYGYGESEAVIGEYLRDKRSDFRIVSKLPKCKAKEATNYLTETLKTLRLDSLYGYIFHDFLTYFFNPILFDWLKEQRRCGKVLKIGFSIYTVEELDELLQKKIAFDLIQLPYNIFDRRFEPFFPILKDKNIEIHARSVFLQGLVFKPLNDLQGIFAKLRNKFKKMDSLSRETNLSRLSLCLNFVRQNKFVDKIVVGVDNLDHMVEIITSASDFLKVKSIQESFSFFPEKDLNILLPFNWKKNLIKRSYRG